MSIAVDAPIAEPRLPAGIPDVPIWKMSVEQYHEMLESGILQSGDPIELLNGWLVPKMTKSPRHVTVSRILARHLELLLPDDWNVWRQDPITTDDSEPEPDLAIVQGIDSDFDQRHPGPEEVALVVEVSHSTLSIDRGLKLDLYARAGIAEYWVVNLVEDVIEVYSAPAANARPARYQQRADFVAGQMIPVTLDGQLLGQIAVDAILV